MEAPAKVYREVDLEGFFSIMFFTCSSISAIVAKDIWYNKCSPVFELAAPKIKLEVRHTEHAGHSAEIAKEMDFSKYRGLGPCARNFYSKNSKPDGNM